MTHLQFRRSPVVSLVSHWLQIPPQSRPGHRVDMSLERFLSIPHFVEEVERPQGSRRD